MRLPLILVVLFLCALAGSDRASAQDWPKVAGIAAPGTPGELYWQQYRDAVRVQSGGRLDVTLMVYGEAGPEETQFSALRRNRLQIGGISTGTLGLALPELAILRAPFLFESQDEVSAVLDDHLLPVISDLLADKDLVLLSWMMDGWSDLYGTFPIRAPDDVRGRKMRVSADDAAQLYLRAVGADVIQIPLSDVIPGLQTGLLDGGEQSTQIFSLAGLDSAATHLTLTHHGYSTAGIVANRGWWESLSAEDRSVFKSAVPDANWYRSLVLDMNAAYLDRARGEGLAVITPNAEELAAWQAAGLAVHDDLIARIGGEAQALYDAVMAAKAAVASK